MPGGGVLRPSQLLLDTHVFIWWRTDSPRLSDVVRETIGSADTVFVSAASAWEVAIKASLGKIRLPESFSSGVRASGFEQLFVRFTHAEAVAQLPHHHRDPFDRILVAQAAVEGLALVTHDPKLHEYDVEIVWS